MLTPLLTHEIGSLAKPGWRVKAAAGQRVGQADIEQARIWGERLDVDGHEALLDLLRRSDLSVGERDEVRQWSSRYGLRFFESAGLDVVYDGEQQRSEMYAWAVAHADGFEFRGTVRSFDDKYYSKAAVIGPIGLRSPFHNEEYELLRAVAKRPIKIPVTGPYTLAAWSFDEHYRGAVDLTRPLPDRHRRQREARREFVLDVARHLVRPNIESLLGLGAQWIQIDEPAGSTVPDEIPLMVEAFDVCVGGLDATFTTHLCFSEYELFFPALADLTGCQQYTVGFANDDSRELGTSGDARPGYRIIEKFRDLPTKPALGLGVLDIHTDFIESPELVRDRILHAVDVFGGPERLQVVPDCGLRTRSWQVAYGKLVNLVAGVELARAELGM
jgi:5-methyltetrahydropteroyltriglutamate--homocysteine methyltransferase